METKVIQITSGRGPAECCLAVALTLKEMITKINDQGLVYEIIERVAGPQNGTLSSALIKVSGKEVNSFTNEWDGVLLWIAQSPYRKFHKRKNWFIGVSSFDVSKSDTMQEKDLKIESMRSSGPGGQNVNKVESAVRITHVPSTLQVVVNESRSQIQNKKIAMQRIKEAIIKHNMKEFQKQGQIQWDNHNQLERGNPRRIYEGIKFKKQN